MRPLRFRPDLRLPWWALAGFAVAVYVIESGLRGWDFRPTLLDGLVYGGLAAMLLLRLFVSRARDDDPAA